MSVLRGLSPRVDQPFGFGRPANTLVAMVVGLVGLTGPVAAQTGEPLVTVAVGAGQQDRGRGFHERFEVPLHAEQARFDVEYGRRASTVVDLSGTVRVLDRLRVGVGYSHAAHDDAVTVTGALPHPFRFDEFRAIEGTEPGLARTDLSVRLDLAYRIPVSRRLEVLVFGGPAWMHVSQDLVDSLQVDERYPFDSAEFTGVRAVPARAWAVGLSAGFDVTWRFTRVLGVGGLVRFARADLELATPGGRPVTVETGGLQATAGLRLAY